MPGSEPIRSRLMTGTLMHRRVQPFAHGFRYRVMMFRIDLGELESLAGRLRLFGIGRARPVRFRREDYLGDLPALLLQHGISGVERVELVTQCRVFGYVFNPISFFFCYAADDRLRAIVCEVHNTFGEAHTYVLPWDAGGDAARQKAVRQKKVFHVSPFFTLDGTYRFRFAVAEERFDVQIDLLRDGQVQFVSRLCLTARPLTDGEVLRGLLRYPLSTLTVIGAIHLQALRLWRKGARYHAKPPYDPDAARRLSSS